MRKIMLSLSILTAGIFGFVGVAGAAPVVDPEAEATSLFNTHAPTVVAVVLAVAGFGITMAVLGAAIRKVRGALGKA